MITIYKTGITATSVIGSVEGIITACSIRGNKISYELSYFNTGEYKTVWLDESEFKTASKKTTRIGFK